MKALPVLALVFATACSPPEIEIAGFWTDGFGTIVVESDQFVYEDDIVHLTRYDNDAGWAVGQNDSGNAYNPDLWSRYDWTRSEGSFFYCQTVYDGATEQAALDATPADASDLTAGCNGFSWSELTAIE